MVHIIWVSGWKGKDGVKVNKHGVMDQFMKVNGYAIKHMVEENYNMLMVISMKVNGN